MEEWKSDLNMVKYQAKGDKDDTSPKIEGKIKDLEARFDKGKQKLKNLAETGKDKWESLMEAIEKTWKR